MGSTISKAATTAIAASAAAITAGNAPGTPAHDDGVELMVGLALISTLSAAVATASTATGQTKIEIADATRTGTGKIAAGPLGSTKIFGESN